MPISFSGQTDVNTFQLTLHSVMLLPHLMESSGWRIIKSNTSSRGASRKPCHKQKRRKPICYQSIKTLFRSEKLTGQRGDLMCFLLFWVDKLVCVSVHMSMCALYCAVGVCVCVCVCVCGKDTVQGYEDLCLQLLLYHICWGVLWCTHVMIKQTFLIFTFSL